MVIFVSLLKYLAGKYRCYRNFRIMTYFFLLTIVVAREAKELVFCSAGYSYTADVQRKKTILILVINHDRGDLFLI